MILNRGERTLLVGWIAIAAVVLEAFALALAVLVWGVPALIVVGPVVLASVIVTVVLWLTVVPQRLLRAHLERLPSPGAPAGRRGPGGSGWSSDSGSTSDRGTDHGWHSSSGSGWSGAGPVADATPSGSWSDSTSSGWSDSSSSGSSSGSSDSSSSSSSDSSSSSW